MCLFLAQSRTAVLKSIVLWNRHGSYHWWLWVIAMVCCCKQIIIPLKDALGQTTSPCWRCIFINFPLKEHTEVYSCYARGMEEMAGGLSPLVFLTLGMGRIVALGCRHKQCISFLVDTDSNFFFFFPSLRIVACARTRLSSYVCHMRTKIYGCAHKCFQFTPFLYICVHWYIFSYSCTRSCVVFCRQAIVYLERYINMFKKNTFSLG